MKINLDIHTLEEANILNSTLASAITFHKGCAEMIRATEEERIEHGHKARVLETLQNRLVS